LAEDKVCPIFQVSSVTGKGIPELIKFLSFCKNRDTLNLLIKKETDPLEFDIHENFLVSGIGVVVSGVVKSGIAKTNQVCLLGPDKNKNFKSVVIKGIHVHRTQTE